MTTFSITITDPASLAGIAEARNVYNSGLPNPDGMDIESLPGYLATDEQYVEYVMTRAAESYARQFGFDEAALAKQEEDLAMKRQRLDAMKSSPVVRG